MSTGCKANGKIQAGCSRSKLCERCKWKSVGRKNDQVKEEWKKYMEKLLNENTWDNAMPQPVKR